MGMACEQVCTRNEKKITRWIPPVYGTRPRLVCVSPAKVEEKVTQGVWATREEDVLVCPERTGWEKTCCPPANLAPGEVQCECVVKKVCPPVWSKEQTRVCVAPDKRCVVFTPAQYKCVEERYLISEGYCQECSEPPEFGMRSREVCVTPGHWEWRRNEACEVPTEKPLPALEVEMKDVGQSGKEEGVFGIGDIIRYELVVKSDVGNQQMPPLRVVFTLPSEVEFVSGGGEDGITVSGNGQTAESSVFQLGLDGQVNVHVLARVRATPPMNLLQVRASVRTADGEQLAEESESSTIK
jgi:hypothetical protein